MVHFKFKVQPGDEAGVEFPADGLAGKMSIAGKSAIDLTQKPDFINIPFWNPAHRRYAIVLYNLACLLPSAV